MPRACLSVSCVPIVGTHCANTARGPQTQREWDIQITTRLCVSQTTRISNGFLLMWASMQLTTHSASFIQAYFPQTSSTSIWDGITAWNLKMGSASLFFALSPEGENSVPTTDVGWRLACNKLSMTDSNKLIRICTSAAKAALKVTLIGQPCSESQRGADNNNNTNKTHWNTVGVADWGPVLSLPRTDSTWTIYKASW